MAYNEELLNQEIRIDRLGHILRSRAKKDWDAVVAITGYEGCQPKGSRVLMANRKWKNIEKIRVGDKILSGDGMTFVKVKETHNYKKCDIYEVVIAGRFVKEILYRCSGNHLIPTCNGSFDLTEAKNLGSKNMYASPRFYGKICECCKFNKLEFKYSESIMIEKQEKKEDVYGFELDSKDGLYITDNYMVTHNSSKSTLSIQLAKFADSDFTIDRQMIWFANEEKVKSLISDLPKYSCIVADEAIKLLFKQNWQSKLSKFMNMLFTVSRDENKIVFLLMPRFVDFNEYFRNHRIFLWIHVVERGVAVVFKKEWSPFATDPWNVAYNSKLIMELPKRKETMNITDKIKILSRCKGFLCWFRYDDLDKDTKKHYRKLKNRNKYATEHDEQATDMKKDKMLSCVRIARLINNIAEKTGQKAYQICQDTADISPETYRKYEKIRAEHDSEKNFIVDKENDKYWEELKAKRIAEREKQDEEDYGDDLEDTGYARDTPGEDD